MPLEEFLADQGSIAGIDKEKSPEGEVLADEAAEIVLNHDFPDPSVAEFDGKFYAHATETIRDGKVLRIQSATSDDLRDWELFQGDALIELPEWSRGIGTWAPFVIEDKERGKFLMYYAVATRNDGHGISVAESDNPLTGFIDRSKQPIISGIHDGETTVHIDPYVYRQDGQLKMIWGSAGQPLMQKTLTADGKALENPEAPAETLLKPIPGDRYERVIEGAYLDEHEDKTYLYYSGADCFGNWNEQKDGEYAVMAARYNPETELFERRTEVMGTPDNVVVGGNALWKNPGNNSIIHYGNDIWLFSHVINRTHPYFAETKFNRRPMIRTRIAYENGWPVGKGPKAA